MSPRQGIVAAKTGQCSLLAWFPWILDVAGYCCWGQINLMWQSEIEAMTRKHQINFLNVEGGYLLTYKAHNKKLGYSQVKWSAVPKTDAVEGVRKQTAQRVARRWYRFEVGKYMSPGRTSVARSEKYFLAVLVASPLCMCFLQLKNSSLVPQARHLLSSYECRTWAMTLHISMQRAPFWCFLGNLCLSA